MASERSDIDGSGGIGVEDLPGILRELFDDCVRDARAEADPATDFTTFVDALWSHLDSAFSLTRQDWPADAPKPWPVEVNERRGLAESVLEGQASEQDLPG